MKRAEARMPLWRSMLAMLAAFFVADWLDRWLAFGRTRDGICPGCGEPSPDGLPCQSCTTW